MMRYVVIVTKLTFETWCMKQLCVGKARSVPGSLKFVILCTLTCTCIIGSPEDINSSEYYN